MSFIDRLAHMWTPFTEVNRRDDTRVLREPSSTRPLDRSTRRFYNDRSIVSAIYTRIAIDFAEVVLRHVKVDDEGQYLEDVASAFNDCLQLEPNLDQGPRHFRQDGAMTLFDKGVIALVPVVTGTNPKTNDNFDIFELRVGEIVEWRPRHVRVSVYNDKKGMREEVTLEKRLVAIVENPLYAVMNEPNSTLQRLIRKLQILDTVDEQSGSGKLDLIIQLPYTIKSEAKRQQAEQRRQDIEFQLQDSRYGIAYADGTEKIVQLNRPAENNLFTQVEYLINMLYGQLGITEEIMNGTADEKTMLNYFNRTIKPLLDGFVEAMQRTFINVTSMASAGERIKYFRDPFALVPLGDIAEIADKFTRNEIFTSNEIRGYMGVKPSKDPKANELRNSNMPQPTESQGTSTLERTVQNDSNEG